MAMTTSELHEAYRAAQFRAYQTITALHGALVLHKQAADRYGCIDTYTEKLVDLGTDIDQAIRAFLDCKH